MGCVPDVTAARATGRLSLLMQRDGADDGCWVGTWRLMVAYKARLFDAMLMPTVAELLWPVAAGPNRGARWSRLLLDPGKRLATRNVLNVRAANRLDLVALNTNRNDQPACNAVVNIYARTRLQIELVPHLEALRAGAPFSIDVSTNVLQGNITTSASLARLIAPTVDLNATVSNLAAKQIPKLAKLEGSKALKFDPGLVLGTLEKRSAKLGRVRNVELEVDIHGDRVMPINVLQTEVAGAYHLGVYVEGTYCPLHAHPYAAAPAMHDHGGHEPAGSACDPDCVLEPFARVLTTTVGLPSERPRRTRAKPAARGRTTRPR
jgi:hypothetical protein